MITSMIQNSKRTSQLSHRFEEDHFQSVNAITVNEFLFLLHQFFFRRPHTNILFTQCRSHQMGNLSGVHANTGTPNDAHVPASCYFGSVLKIKYRIKYGLPIEPWRKILHSRIDYQFQFICSHWTIQRYVFFHILSLQSSINPPPETSHPHTSLQSSA